MKSKKKKIIVIIVLIVLLLFGTTVVSYAAYKSGSPVPSFVSCFFDHVIGSSPQNQSNSDHSKSADSKTSSAESKSNSNTSNIDLNSSSVSSQSSQYESQIANTLGIVDGNNNKTSHEAPADSNHVKQISNHNDGQSENNSSKASVNSTIDSQTSSIPSTSSESAVSSESIVSNSAGTSNYHHDSSSSSSNSAIVEITDIELNLNNLELTVGGTSKLTVGVSPSNTTEDTKATWKSTDKSIATVDDKGNVTALKVGTTEIIVHVGNFSDTCNINVKEEGKYDNFFSLIGLYIKTAYDQITDALNSMNARDIKWTADNDHIEIKDSGNFDGNFYLKSEGETDTSIAFTYTDENNEIQSDNGAFPVYVLNMTNQDNKDILFSPKSGYLNINCIFMGNDKLLFKFSAFGKTYDDETTYTSSNEEVATIGDNGDLKALKNGTTNIIAKCGDKQAKLVITITDPSLFDVEILSNGNGSGEYENGYITATPDDGYNFEKWVCSDGTTSNESEFEYTPTGDVTWTAYFKGKVPCAVSVQSDGSGSVKLAVNDGDYETSKTVDLMMGDTVCIDAKASEGYVFTNWTSTSGKTSDEQEHEYTADGTETWTAHFKTAAKLTLIASGGGTVSGAGSYEPGKEITIKATPNDWYEFTGWSDGNKNLSRTITLDADTTLTANFIASYFGFNTSTGMITGYSGSGPNDVTIPSTISGVTVTSIGDHAFDGRTALTSVTIPDSVTSIGNYAFYECKGIISINIPDSVTSIGEFAFDSCPLTDLTSITIPNLVTFIGDAAFKNCEGLTSINVDPTNVNYLSEDGILYNKDRTALIECATGKIGSVITPNSVTEISQFAFYGCTGLTAITISSSADSIGRYAFFDCTGLTSVTIPDFVTTISDSTFKGCTGLETVNIPSLVTSIEPSAFNDCKKLKSITIPDSVISIGDQAFNECTELESLTIGNSVESINEMAFEGCENLTSIIIPDSVTSIGDSAFRFCIRVTNFTIGNSVASIGDWAFYDCDDITSITIPVSVTSIGKLAFGLCNNLKSILFENRIDATNPTNLTFGDGWYNGTATYQE